jgi:hypothetical protein
MTRRLALAVPLVGLCFWVGCRYNTIWTGADFIDNGETLRLAAAEPLCGCVKVRNVSGAEVHLRSMMEGQELGSRNLPAGELLEEQFDWGGPQERQVFRIETWDDHGDRLPAQQVLSIEDTGWPWHGCGQPGPLNTDTGACADGSLKLKTGRARLW